MSQQASKCILGSPSSHIAIGGRPQSMLLQPFLGEKCPVKDGWIKNSPWSNEVDFSGRFLVCRCVFQKKNKLWKPGDSSKRYHEPGNAPVHWAPVQKPRHSHNIPWIQLIWRYLKKQTLDLWWDFETSPKKPHNFESTEEPWRASW